MHKDRLFRVAALLIIVVLSMALRLYRLDKLPPGLYHDEAYNGLDALSLTQGKTFPQYYEGWELYAAEAHGDRPAQESRWPIFFEGNYGREPLHIYLMALSIKLLGAEVAAIRLVPALAGVIAVLSTYSAASQLLGPQRFRRQGKEPRPRLQRILLDPPLIAAFAMAILFPAVHFSRFGVRAMLFIPLATMTVALFWWGINLSENVSGDKRGRLAISVRFVAAGFFLGLSLYSYAIGRLFPLVFAIFVPFWFWRDRDAFRFHWRNVLAMAVTAFIVALPLLLFFLRYPYFFVLRIAYVANRGKGTVEGRPWLTWLANIGRVARGLFLYGETHLRHNLPGRPYLDPIQSGLFIVGAVYALRQRLQSRTVFLWIWLLVMLLPSILSGDAPHFGRLIGVAPVAATFIGIGWVGMANFLMEKLFGKGRVTAAVMIVFGALLLASALWTTVDYFGRYASQPELPDAFYHSDWQLGEFMAGYADETNLYLTPAQAELATIYFALDGPDRLTNFSGRAGLAPLGIPGNPILYAVRPSDASYLTVLKSYLPGGSEGVAQESYIPYYVAADDNQPTIQGNSDVNWADQISLIGWSQKWQADQLAVTLFWQAEDELDSDYTAFIHVLNDRGELVAQLDRPPSGHPTSNWRAGEVVADTFLLQLPVDGPIELHSLQTGFYDPSTVNNLGPPALLGNVVKHEDDS